MVVMSQDCTQNEQPVILPPDERLRLTTAERLAAQFARVEVFLDHCEALSRRSSHDPVAALAVAARLIRANADLASVLLRAARTETRHRTFSVKAEDELNPKIQPPLPRGAAARRGGAAARDRVQAQQAHSPQAAGV